MCVRACVRACMQTMYCAYLDPLTLEFVKSRNLIRIRFQRNGLRSGLFAACPVDWLALLIVMQNWHGGTYTPVVVACRLVRLWKVG